MIDPKQFIRNSEDSRSLKDIDGSFTCSEPGCFETVTSGKYDSQNKKVFWKCPNNHMNSARLSYE
jgi:hypothetical protein